MKKNIKSRAGFTIIELIVVVAIIAVLAAIVLVNVTSYINKGKDTAIKSNLSGLFTRGVRYFDDSTLGAGTYNTFCTSSSGGAPVLNAIESTNLDGAGTFVCACNSGTTNTCTATSTKWCACAPLKTSTNTFCIDSTGSKSESASGCSSRCVAGSTGGVLSIIYRD